MSLKLKASVTLAAFALCAVTAPAKAAIIMGTVTGGNAGGVFQLITNVAGMMVGNATSAANNLARQNLYGFDEIQGFTLTANQAVNLGGLTTNNGSIATGTRVNSHMIFFDPRNQGQGARTISGQITFQSRILGVIRNNAQQQASDVRFGAAGVTYVNATNRALENNDALIAWATGSNVLDISILNGQFPGDHLRVLTAVPEPAAWALMIAGFGLVGRAMRRRRSVTVTYA